MSDLFAANSQQANLTPLIEPEQPKQPKEVSIAPQWDRAGATWAALKNGYNDAKDGAYHNIIRPMMRGNGFIKNPELLAEMDAADQAVSEGYRKKHVDYDLSHLDPVSLVVTQGVGKMAGTVAGGGFNPLTIGISTYNMGVGEYHRELLKDGMKDSDAWDTAQKMAAPEAAVSMIMPGGVASSSLALRFASRTATGFVWNAALDPVTATWRGHVLNTMGREDLAKKYGHWDAATMLTSGLAGGIMNGVMGGDVTLREQLGNIRDKAAYANRYLNGETYRTVDFAPGIPEDAVSQSAHVEAWKVAHEQALAGQPVDVSNVPGMANAKFYPHVSKWEADAPVLEITPEAQGAAQTRLGILDPMIRDLSAEISAGENQLLPHLPGGAVHKAAQEATGRILNRVQLQDVQSRIANGERHQARLNAELDQATATPITGSGAELAQNRQAWSDNVTAIRAALADTEAQLNDARTMLQSHEEARNIRSQLMPADQQHELLQRVMGARGLRDEMVAERARQQKLADGIPEKALDDQPGVKAFWERHNRETSEHTAKTRFDEATTDETPLPDYDHDVFKENDAAAARDTVTRSGMSTQAAADPMVDQVLRRLDNLDETHPMYHEIRAEVEAIRQEYQKDTMETKMFAEAVTCLLEGFA